MPVNLNSQRVSSHLQVFQVSWWRDPLWRGKGKPSKFSTRNSGIRWFCALRKNTTEETAMANPSEQNHSRNERAGNGGSEKNASSKNAIGSPEFFSLADRRTFLQGATAVAATLAMPRWAQSHPSDLDDIRAEIEKRHDESVKRLQTWIRQPSIAAENRGMNEGCELTIQMLRDAGFQQATKIPTDGQPGIFATLDAGASKTLGLYFMYDVKQADPAEWSSPPFEAALVDKPGLGKVVMGRGAVNQKGPEASFFAALHAIRGAGKKIPVNLVFVAEGEEEIGSPHFPQIVHRPEVMAALKKCTGIFMPNASQGLDGEVIIALGAKGVIECELTSSGERWGRGPRKDVHSSNKARLDSPAWHLVEALATLVSPDGNDPAIEGYTAKVRPLSDGEKKMIAEAARRLSEADAKKLLGVERWVHDVNWQEALELLMSRPTVNIEGLVGGYTGPGGKTILPGKATAKLDLRLVPDMTAAEALAALKAHLAKKGFGDIDVRMTGGYDPTSTPQDAAIIHVETAVYRRGGIDPVLLPRNAGSWPGYVFTGDPLRLPAGHFGLGHGSGAHAPDEYYVIESKNPKVQGIDGAVRSFAEFLFELAQAG
jgi:acetylornithine deacetylase/succinyl-diaminopimelate desuccinylase-like protein